MSMVTRLLRGWRTLGVTAACVLLVGGWLYWPREPGCYDRLQVGMGRDEARAIWEEHGYTSQGCVCWGWGDVEFLQRGRDEPRIVLTYRFPYDRLSGKSWKTRSLREWYAEYFW